MPGPTLSRRRLGAELKRCREAAGLTQEQVSQRFEWHTAKALTGEEPVELVALLDESVIHRQIERPPVKHHRAIT
ncbi:MAG: hypothetical protein SYR96_12305, partial [Actinomycetota bacterium]|nr:hypothetical protein [Actinomycetota bacterium]